MPRKSKAKTEALNAEADIAKEEIKKESDAANVPVKEEIKKEPDAENDPVKEEINKESSEVPLVQKIHIPFVDEKEVEDIPVPVYVVEISKSARALCKRCDEKIMGKVCHSRNYLP